VSLGQIGEEVCDNTNLKLIFIENGTNAHVYIPVLATSWSLSADGLTWTFNLRNGVYFSNGDKFNAYVVWWTIYRDMLINQPADGIFFSYFNTTGVTVGDVNSLDNAQNMPNATLLSVMQNPQNSVTVVNSTEVLFHLSAPYPPFLASMIPEPWDMIDPHIVAQHGGVVLNQPNSWMSVNGPLVGDGPYVMKEYVPNQYTILVENPNYWAQNLSESFIFHAAHIPEVIINYKPDELTRVLDAESNRAQVAIIAFTDLDSALAADSYLYSPKAASTGVLEFITLDAQKAPTDNVLVRRAIIESINVSQIQQVAFVGSVESFVGPYPKEFPGYNASISGLSYNLTDAKNLLAEAGYPGGSGLPALDFLYPQSSTYSEVAQLIVQDLGQIGITVNPREVSFPTYFTIIPTPGANASAPYLMEGVFSYFPDFAGYEYIVDQQLGVYGNLNNQTINNLIIQSNSETNTTLRTHEISEIISDVQQNAAYVWIGEDLNAADTGVGIGPTIANSCVTGIYYSPVFNGFPLNSMYYTCTPQ
jgi:ABC-type transport system substrate-binding protein